MVTIWSKRAMHQLENAYTYIYAHSPKNAVKVRDEIIDATITLSKHPESYPADKYKKDNDGTWRAFEMYHYRISYQIRPTEIYVVRVRHTSRSPSNY